MYVCILDVYIKYSVYIHNTLTISDDDDDDGVG